MARKGENKEGITTTTNEHPVCSGGVDSTWIGFPKKIQQRALPYDTDAAQDRRPHKV